MSQASDYLENRLIDHIFRTGTFAKPSGLFVALFTTAPSDAGGGTEVAAGGYARVSAGVGDASWRATQGGNGAPSSGTGGQTSNSVVITFPLPTANWGTVTHIGLFDAATGGNLLVWNPLTTPRPINNGDGNPQFLADALTITVG